MQEADSRHDHSESRSGLYDEMTKIEHLRREQQARIRARSRALQASTHGKPAKAGSLPFVRRSTARR